MMLGRLLPVVALLATGAVAADSARLSDRDQQRLDRTLAGRVPGERQSCVELSRVTGPEPIGTDIVLYRQSARRIWVNRLRASCPALRGDSLLIVDVTGSQLCERDRFQVITRPSSIPSGSCFFGYFTPYDKPAQSAR